jgi:WD40 repeat protein
LFKRGKRAEKLSFVALKSSFFAFFYTYFPLFRTANIRLTNAMSLTRWYLLLLILLTPILRAAEKQLIAEVKAKSGNMTATAISGDAQFILTCEDDGLVLLWNVKTRATLRIFKGHTGGVFAASFLPDGKRIVTCGDDNRLIVWDLATARPLRQMSTGDSIPLVMSCSPDGAIAATGCNDGQIFIWHLSDGRLITRLRRDSSLCGLLFSPNGRLLAAGYSDGHVVLWDVSTWSQERILPDANAASVGALAFPGDSRLLATGNQNGAGFVWNTADGSRLPMFAGYAHPEATPSPPVAPVFPGSAITPDNRSSIVFLCLSPDSKTILASIQDQVPRLWETKTGRLLGTVDWFEDYRFYIPRYGFTFSTASVTPRRDFIVTTRDGQNDSRAQVWRLSFAPSSSQ